MAEHEKMEEYDVVIDTLQSHSDKLWKLTNTYHEWGIMDHIRLEQMDILKKAIECWKKYKHEYIPLNETEE